MLGLRLKHLQLVQEQVVNSARLKGYDWAWRCTDTPDLGHFGHNALWTYWNSDPGHVGVTEVTQHFGNGAEVSSGHLALDSTYIEDQTDCICKGGNWTFHPLVVSPQDVLPLAWTFRLLDVSPLDDSYHTHGHFAPKLSIVGISRSRSGRMACIDGRFAALAHVSVKS